MAPSLAALALLTLGTPGPVEDPGALTHFAECPRRGGAGATIIVPASVGAAASDGTLDVGDELAVLAPDGSCAGAGVWNGEGIAVTVWEDDPFTPVLDGLLEGDPIQLAAYDASEGAPLATDALTYEATFSPGEGFSRDGLYVLAAKSSTSGEGGPGEGGVRLEQAYPNPVRGTATIPFVLAEAGPVTLELYDVLGRRVSALVEHETYGPGHQRFDLDATGLAPGTYVYRLAVDGEVRQRTLTVAR